MTAAGWNMPLDRWGVGGSTLHPLSLQSPRGCLCLAVYNRRLSSCLAGRRLHQQRAISVTGAVEVVKQRCKSSALLKRARRACLGSRLKSFLPSVLFPPAHSLASPRLGCHRPPQLRRRQRSSLRDAPENVESQGPCQVGLAKPPPQSPGSCFSSSS